MSSSFRHPAPSFRSPWNGTDLLPSLPFQSPFEDLLVGDWYLIRSSNAFFSESRNVRFNYKLHPSGHIENIAYYIKPGSSGVRNLPGKDVPLKDEQGVYMWQGKGFYRVARARWEILRFEKKEDGRDWMLVFQHGSLFSSPAINIMCRQKGGIRQSDLEELEGWFAQVEHVEFRKAVLSMVDVMHN